VVYSAVQVVHRRGLRPDAYGRAPGERTQSWSSRTPWTGCTGSSRHGARRNLSCSGVTRLTNEAWSVVCRSAFARRGDATDSGGQRAAYGGVNSRVAATRPPEATHRLRSCPRRTGRWAPPTCSPPYRRRRSRASVAAADHRRRRTQTSPKGRQRTTDSLPDPIRERKGEFVLRGATRRQEPGATQHTVS
jgi:hypothetical protein